ncbi:MAG TPA: hypothetical protein VG602_01110 [Actinomycetota bacterium]|nr:hypothetical protein [Actinomycetota bacterium]
MVELVAASRLGDFVAGLTVGAMAGLFLARVFWAWAAWREWRDASAESDRREAHLSDEVLERMEEDLARQNAPTDPERTGTWPRPRPS